MFLKDYSNFCDFVEIFFERLFKFLWFPILHQIGDARCSRCELHPVLLPISTLENIFSHEELSILENILDQGWIKSRLSGRTHQAYRQTASFIHFLIWLTKTRMADSKWNKRIVPIDTEFDHWTKCGQNPPLSFSHWTRTNWSRNLVKPILTICFLLFVFFFTNFV